MSPSAVAQRAEQLLCSFPRRDGRIARHLHPTDRGPVCGVQYAAPNRNMARAFRIGRDAVLTTGVLHAANWGSKAGDHIACNTGIGC
jgi:hypothetical protein